MKKIIRTALLGTVAAAAAVGLAPTASADSSYSYDALVYLQMLNNDGITINDAAAAISTGYGMCSDLANGYTPVQVAYTLYLNVPSYTKKNAADHLGDAVISFCPQYLSALSRPGQVPYTPGQVA